MRELLALKPRPDAIFCANDDMAIAAIEVARHEFGMDVGREVGVAGFDDSELASWPSFDLTTYSLPVEAVIDGVMTMLMSVEGPDEQKNILVEGELKVRGSTQRRRGLFGSARLEAQLRRHP